MKNLAFKIVNRLLNNEMIVDHVGAMSVQAAVESVLAEDPRFREAIVHFAQVSDDLGEPICHQVGGNPITTRDSERVTCLRCLESMRLKKQPWVVEAMMEGEQFEQQTLAVTCPNCGDPAVSVPIGDLDSLHCGMCVDCPECSERIVFGTFTTAGYRAACDAGEGER